MDGWMSYSQYVYAKLEFFSSKFSTVKHWSVPYNPNAFAVGPNGAEGKIDRNNSFNY